MDIHYAAITGDLVASRTHPDRTRVQKETLAILNGLNLELKESLARPAVLTAGDEVQALLLKPSRIVRMVQAIKDHLFGSAEPGQDVVFGVGWGTLSLDPPETMGVEQLDGPCFHLAREALIEAKKNGTWAVFRGFSEIDDQTLSSLFGLMGAIRSRWTAKQSLYAVTAREHAKRIDVAREWNVSPSVITESLQSSSFDAILRGEQAAQDVLGAYDT